MPHLLPLISKLESCNDRIVGQQKKPRMFFCLIKAISIWEKFGLRPFLWFETWAEADFQFTTLISSICHACFSSEESAVYSVLGVSTALRNIAQLLHTPSLSATPEAQRRKKTPTLKGIVSVLSVAGADIRNQRVTPPSLIIELFNPTPTPFFFLPSRHQNSTSSPHLLRPLFICWHTSVGVQQSSGKEEIPQSGECARERRCSVEAFKRTEVRRTSWWVAIIHL